MKWTSKSVIGSVVVLVACLGWALSKSLRQPGLALKVCLPKSPASNLALVAIDQGYFSEEGLAVTPEIAELGKDCVGKLLKKDVELAVSNVPPVVSAIEQGNPLIVLTELSSSTQNTALVFLKKSNVDPDVEKDLLGKKVGMVENTNSETFLRLFFKSHDMDPRNMQFVNLKSMGDLGKSLKAGEIQAAVLWEPFLTKYLQTFTPGTVVSQNSVFYTQFCVLASTNDYANKHTAALEGFVRALTKAQEYNKHNREKARQLAIAKLHFTPEELQPSVWNKFRFEVGLSSVLITMMQQSQQPLIDLPDAIENQRVTLVFRSLYPQVLRKITKDLVTYE